MRGRGASIYIYIYGVLSVRLGTPPVRGKNILKQLPGLGWRYHVRPLEANLASGASWSLARSLALQSEWLLVAEIRGG